MESTDRLATNRKAAFYTLGCKLNFSETSSIANALSEVGIRRVRPGEEADYVIVNTCTVTAEADRKSRQAIRMLIRRHPRAFVIVMGCYAQLRPQDIGAIPGVSLVVGQNDKGRIPELIGGHPQPKAPPKSSPKGRTSYSMETSTELYPLPVGEGWGGAVSPPSGESKEGKEICTFVPSCSRGDRTRYWLKVQDGCDYFCSYCTVPHARGRSRNGSIASMVEQAEAVAREGGREIVITGVNIGDFGKTTGETFFDLIRALDAVEGIQRYRISSIEPNLLTDEIIDYVATSRAFMPHFHIPLQSGCDEVLRLMRRRYDTALFAQKIQHIKSVLPHAFIGVDVIVGTRGETEASFRRTYDFLDSLDVTQLHVFSYSERPGTSALQIEGPVSLQKKRCRSEQLLSLSESKTYAFYAAHIGSEAIVLLEHPKQNAPFHGFTENYIRTEINAPAGSTPLVDNTLVRVRMEAFNERGDALTASIIEP
jgi:threonylcarbamoyladenosine tRNA methylthiotransferase MtaB